MVGHCATHGSSIDEFICMRLRWDSTLPQRVYWDKPCHWRDYFDRQVVEWGGPYSGVLVS